MNSLGIVQLVCAVVVTLATVVGVTVFGRACTTITINLSCCCPRHIAWSVLLRLPAPQLHDTI